MEWYCMSSIHSFLSRFRVFDSADSINEVLLSRPHSPRPLDSGGGESFDSTPPLSVDRWKLKYGDAKIDFGFIKSDGAFLPVNLMTFQ